MQKQELWGFPLSFWVVTLVAFINSVSFTMIIPILYPYAQEFGLSDFQASLLTTSYAASQFIGTPILGRLSDRWGRKPLLIVSLVGTVLSNLVASVAPVASLLYGARILDGLTGGNTSIARAIISDTTSESQRPQAFGAFDATFRLGFVVGPALSYGAQSLPTFPQVSSLGMSFFCAAVMAAVATLLSVVLLGETHIRQTTESGLDKPRGWDLLGIGKTLQGVQDPQYSKLFLLTFFSGFTFTIFTFAFQPFFLKVLNQEAQTLAIFFAVIGMIGFLTQVFGLKPLRHRFNLVMILSLALVVRGILFLLIPTFPIMIIFSIIMVVFGAVNSFPLPLINTLVSLKTNANEQGEVLGINASYLSIANALGPATAGLLVGMGYRAPLWITGILTLITAGYAYSLEDPSAEAEKTL